MSGTMAAVYTPLSFLEKISQKNLSVTTSNGITGDLINKRKLICPAEIKDLCLVLEIFVPGTGLAQVSHNLDKTGLFSFQVGKDEILIAHTEGGQTSFIRNKTAHG
jgi:hypothetical protein